MSEIVHDQKSPTENMFGKIARLLNFFGKIPDPKTGGKKALKGIGFDLGTPIFLSLVAGIVPAV